MILTRLFTTLLVLVVATSSFSFFRAIDGFNLCLIIFGLSLAIYTRRWAWCVMAALGLWLLVGLLTPAVAAARGAALRMQCMHNLNEIARAVLEYERLKGSLPPPYIADKNGRPIHSWRVLILPYLGHQELFDRYDFNEPWDGPHNRTLLADRPSVYYCPGDEYAKSFNRTNYVAIVGSHAAWGKNRLKGLQNISGEKLSATVLLAETADVDIKWTEPRDISLDELARAESGKDVVTVRSKHGCYGHGLLYDYEAESPDVAQMAFADGHVTSIFRKPLTIESVSKLLTIGGYDEVDDRAAMPFVEQDVKATLRWSSCFVLTVWIISTGLLLYQAVRTGRARQRVAAIEAS